MLHPPIHDSDAVAKAMWEERPAGNGQREQVEEHDQKNKTKNGEHVEMDFVRLERWHGDLRTSRVRLGLQSTNGADKLQK